MTNSLIAISNHGSMLGGGEHSFFDLVSHLPSNWCPIVAVPEEGDLSEKLKTEGVETRVISLPTIRPLSVIDMIAATRGFLNVTRNHWSLLIYCNGSRAAFYGGIAGGLLRIPVIWHCRIADPDPYFDLFLATLSSRIVTNSRATARRFRARIRQKVRVVYNGVNIRWLQNESIRKPAMIQDDWKVILVVARVSRWKRHDLAIFAFECVAESEPNAHLVCVGAEDVLEPKWWAYLQQLTHRSQFSERIHWIGHIDDTRPWYKAAELLVLPSENEPFGRVLVEAMASGVPVVATRSGGIPEIVRHNKDGISVTPGSVREVAEAIKKLLRDDKLRRRFGIAGKERARAFSLEAHVEKMVQVFEETKSTKFL